MSSTIGNKLQISLYGESHATAIGVVVNGLPSGFKIDFDKLNKFLQRRKTNQNKYTTKRKETDEFDILSGYYNDKTTGTPLSIIIKNIDAHSKDYNEIFEKMRPSHADYTGYIKYKGYNDMRGGGHFSGRLTAPLCIIGGISLQILEKIGISIYSHISSLYDIDDIPIEQVSIAEQKKVAEKEIAIFDDDKIKQVKNLLEKITQDNDSIGGIVELIVHNMVIGVGSPIFDSIESRLSHMIFSIPSVKGLEFGNGFSSTKLTGIQNNDAFEIINGQVITTTNNSGGINGGISNGMPVTMKVAIKPTASISKTQNTINIKTMQNTTINIAGRHDPAIVLRIPPVLESAVAITLLDMLLEEKGDFIYEYIYK